MDSDAEAALLALFAKWQIRNQTTAIYYAAAIFGLMGCFVLQHLVKTVIERNFKPSHPLRLASRSLEHFWRLTCGERVVAGFIVFPGRILLALTYFAINIALTFYDDAISVPGRTIFAKRLGWMALLNMTLAIFLGLKNTPLSPLAGQTYQELNLVHRCCGYTTVLYVVLHASIYASGLFAQSAEFVLLEPAQYAGFAAGISMVLIFVTATGFMRRRNYEVFYIAHIVLVMTILISVGLHRPDLTTVGPILTIIAGSLWGLDRLYRSIKTSAYFLGNYATLTPLHDGTTKVTLHRPLPRARPGSHAFLWIPGVRFLERHPFTMISRAPNVEFIVKGRDGFTRALHRSACAHPAVTGVRFRVSVEGPYGNPTDVLTGGYEKLLLVAGGSGVTFTLGLALEWARRRRTPRDKGLLEFVWVVREAECFEWCDAEIAELFAHPRVAVHLYVSGSGQGRLTAGLIAAASHEQDSSRETSLDASGSSTPDEKNVELGLVLAEPTPVARQNSAKERYYELSDDQKPKKESIVEVAARKAAKTKHHPPAHMHGRPALAMHLERVMEGVEKDGKVLVAGCGPDRLLADVRMLVAKVPVSAEAPVVDLRVEEFSY